MRNILIYCKWYLDAGWLIDLFKDDANHDPQWSEDQIIAAGMTLAGITITAVELDVISKTTIAVFEILERAWATQDCTLIDMKIEFGVDVSSSESNLRISSGLVIRLLLARYNGSNSNLRNLFVSFQLTTMQCWLSAYFDISNTITYLFTYWEKCETVCQQPFLDLSHCYRKVS